MTAKTPAAQTTYPKQGGALSRGIGKAILKMMGWRLEGQWPDEDKLVIVGAPHTSNWDLFLAIGMFLSQNLRLSWMMKKEAFIWPLGPLWRKLGGIPIDRKAAQDIVEQTAEVFAARDKMYLGITPEGTRSSVKGYRKGYLRIAQAANVPVFICGLDSKRKVLTLDRLWPLTGDIDADNTAIETYVRTNYRGIKSEND